MNKPKWIFAYMSKSHRVGVLSVLPKPPVKTHKTYTLPTLAFVQ